METGRTQSLCLISGGLDSVLAAVLVREQGVELQGLLFTSPLWDPAPARSAAELLAIRLEEIDFTTRMFEVFARCPTFDDVTADLNLECHAEMLKWAVALLDEFDCGFVTTGEVLNQNGHTQTEASLESLAAGTGRPEWILRPLSARRLPLSEPERRGWIDRQGLGDLEGDRRDDQEALAARHGIPAEAFPPRGRGPLADPDFVARLQDLRAHEGLGGKRSLVFLTLGRHFRLGPVTKLVVGRSATENRALEAAAELYDLVLRQEGRDGPTGLLPILATDDQIRAAAGVCVRLGGTTEEADVAVRGPRGSSVVRVRPASHAEIELVEIRPRPAVEDLDA